MTDEQTAAAIVADCDQAGCLDGLKAAIVRALQAARKAPPGHIIDDAGVVRKVMRTIDIGKYPCDQLDRIGDVLDNGQQVIICEAAEAAKEGKA